MEDYKVIRAFAFERDGELVQAPVGSIVLMTDEEVEPFGKCVELIEEEKTEIEASGEEE